MVVPVLLLLAGVQVSAPQAQDRYGLVLVERGDTTAIERVTRERGALRAEVLVPNRARLVVAARTDSLGCVTEADVRVFPWGATDGATPARRVNVRLVDDSVRVEASARGATQSAARAYPQGRFVQADESIAAASLLLECARSMRTPGVDTVVLPVVAFPGLRLASLRVSWAGDSAMIVGRDTSWAYLDRAGALSRMVVGGGTLVVHRVSARDLDAMSFAATDYSAPAGAPYRAETVRVPVSADIVLAGTLTLPAGAAGRVPAVVTISGSGPQDRDSYASVAGGWRPFRQLADTLARRGVAVLRLDDRGVGGSTGDYGASTERTAAADIHAAIAFLRARPDVAADRIAVLGHSEGARVAMLVASEDRALAAVALLSGAADPRAAYRAQAVWLAEHGPRGGPSRDSVIAAVDRQMDSLAAVLPGEVLRWDAAGLARLIRAPVGIFQGATDRQVPADQADSLGALFRRARNRDVTVRVFPDRNHLLVRDPDGDFLRYDRLASALLDPEVLGTISDWLVSKLGEPSRGRR